jgi:hypothetical protein
MTADDNPCPGHEAGTGGLGLPPSDSPAGPEAGVLGIPGGADDEDFLDVAALAGAVPADGGEWLLVIELDGQPGASFQVLGLPGDTGHAQGGDVLLRLLPEPGSGTDPAVRAEVWAVIGGRVILAGTWAGQDPGGWPEQVRPAVAFGMGILAELEDHGADLGVRHRVRLAAADTASTGVPAGLTSGRVPVTGPSPG